MSLDAGAREIATKIVVDDIASILIEEPDPLLGASAGSSPASG